MVGDTNINIQNNNKQSSQYVTLIESLGFHLLNNPGKKYATRVNKHANARHTFSSTLDHVITNNISFKFNIGINDSHISDHKQIFLSFRDTSNAVSKFALKSQSFSTKKLDLEMFKCIVRREINTYKPNNFSVLLRIITNAKNRCTYTRTLNIKFNPYKRWITTELRHIIAQRNRYHSLMKQYPNNAYAQQQYSLHCKHASELNNKLRRNYNSARLNKFLNKPKKLWKCFNEIIHNKTSNTNAIRAINAPNNVTTNDPITIANTFNDYFCNIGRELSAQLPNTEPTYHTLIPNNSRTMALFPSDRNEIINILKQIKQNSNLNDFLPSDHLKKCSDILAEPISTCLNECFSSGEFPNNLKCARIVPIFKDGDSLLTGNYRPISIISDSSKIVEQSKFNRIYDFALNCNLIDNKQFGFQRRSGTLSAAISLLDEIRLNLDKSNKNIAACLFLDVSKAFDTIPRDLLMKKLYRYGFRGKSYDLINSYLTNRTQYVEINGTKSETLFNNFGTPQGSTLGPLLFLLYINDIFQVKLYGKIVMFADDSALSYCCTNLTELRRMMESDLATISNWFISNKLTLNSRKSKFMIIHPNQNSKKFAFDLKLNNEIIEQVHSFKYLGLTIQDNLHWDIQIGIITSKMSRIAGVMSRIGNNVNKQFLISIYYSHIHSHISYMSSIWGHSSTEYLIDSIQVAQNNAIRSIFRNEYYAHALTTNEIRKKYNILSVRQVIKFNTSCLAYKITHRLMKSDIVITTVADRHNYATRNAHSLNQHPYRSNAGKFCTNRVIAVEYNSIPIDITNCPSFNIFKKQIKKYILENN